MMEGRFHVKESEAVGEAANKKPQRLQRVLVHSAGAN